MSKPRCGNPDIVNNININFPLSSSIHSRMLYKFAPGLDHTDVHDALMYPTFDRGMVKGIGIDDEAGIRALYGT
ncbi:hypothetical protein QQ045_008273 [Rhodiola kirilowii]